MYILYSPTIAHYYKKLCLSTALLGLFNAPLQASLEEPTTNNSKASQAIDLLEYKYALLQIQKESNQSAADKAPFRMKVGGICLTYWLCSFIGFIFSDGTTPAQMGLSCISFIMGYIATICGLTAWAINSNAEKKLPLIQKQIAILREQQSNKNM